MEITILKKVYLRLRYRVEEDALSSSENEDIWLISGAHEMKKGEDLQDVGQKGISKWTEEPPTWPWNPMESQCKFNISYSQSFMAMFIFAYLHWKHVAGTSSES